MADNYNGDYNRNGRYSGSQQDRSLEDIFADVDETYDYDSTYSERRSGSAGTGARASSGSAYNSGTRSAARQASGRPTASRQTSARQTYARSTGARDSYGDQVYRGSQSGQIPSARRPASSAARYRNNLFKKRKRKFRKYLLIYVAVLVVLLIIGCVIFSSYLASYEKSQPYHVAEKVVEAYQSQDGIVSFLNDNASKTGASDSIASVADSYATNIAGKKISYQENSDFRPDTPSYDIMADGSVVAKVTFAESSGSDSFAKSKWAIQNLNVLDYLPNAMTITVDAPEGALVTVNGKILDESYIVSSGVPAILENSLKFLQETPQFNTYQIAGLLSEPLVTVTDASGTVLQLTHTDNSYVASPAADQAFIDSVEDRVYDAIDNYATYFIHMSYDLANYIVYDSDLYSYIFGSDEMDPIATALYMFEDIESYEFTERSASNYVKYADDCFTVDIKYALDMRFTDPTYEDNNQNMDATWVFVIEPLDGSWCISEIINH